MSDLTPQVPNHTAWFAVGIPARISGANTPAEAVTIVARYLYQGEVTDCSLSEDATKWIVTVRVEAHGGTTRAQLMNRVKMQADRFASGLYPVGEAIIR